jgi:hypothetical protein
MKSLANYETVSEIFSQITSSLSICNDNFSIANKPCFLNTFNGKRQCSGPVIICTDPDPSINNKKNIEKPLFRLFCDFFMRHL